MKTLFISVFICLSVFANAQTIAEWNFNSIPNDLDLATGNNLPRIGSGTITNIGFVTNSFENATGSSDPVPSDNTSYSTSNYPNSTENDKTAGIEIAINTTGYVGIVFKFDLSCFQNAANEYVVQYSIDGNTFTDLETIIIAPDNADVFLNNIVIDASFIRGLNNNANAKFRIVSSFAGNSSSYTAVNDISAIYNSTANVKFDMIIVKALSVLPVSIISFTGAYTNNTSLLKWSVGNEININKYAVERSIDGKTFTEIGFVNANGSNEYTYTDATAKTVINFYRLRIVGVNETKYSAVVKILSDAFGSKLNVYPSPAVNTVNAEFTSQQKTTAYIQFTDAGGRTVLQKNMQVQQGYNNLSFDINNFNKGMYILKITMGKNVVSSSFNKL